MRKVIVRAWGHLASDGCFIATHRIANKKKSGPTIFRMQSMPPPWAWSSFVPGSLSQAMCLYSNAHNRDPKMLRPETFPKATHAAAMGALIGRCLPPLDKRSV